MAIIQIDRDLCSEVAKETREIDGKIGEFIERKVTAEDQLKRVDIRAPQDGMVFQSTVHTVGGVITAGDAVMLIVPDADQLSVEAKVNPQDIDQIQIGQTAMLRFSALNQRTTPEIFGKVTRIAADATTDQRTGQTYYTIRIAMPPERNRQARRRQAVAGHAGRSLRADWREDNDFLFDQAITRSSDAHVPRVKTGSPTRRVGSVRLT